MKAELVYLFSGLVISFMVLPFTARAQETYIFGAEEDAWVNEDNPAANYGSSTYLSVRDRASLAEVYIKFSQDDFDSLSGQEIGAASLFLYQYQGANSPGDILNLRKIISDWGELTVDWNNRPEYDLAFVSSVDISGAANFTGWREWPGLEGMVSVWAREPNFGLALENHLDGYKDELYARFYSSEYSDSSLRPYLKIVTTPEPVSTVLFLLGGGVLSLLPKLRKSMPE